MKSRFAAKFKAGDRLVDTGMSGVSLKNRCKVIFVKAFDYVVRFDDGREGARDFDDMGLIPEDIYDSPLYQALL